MLNLRPTLRHLQELAEEAQVLFEFEVVCDYIYGFPGTGLEFLEEDLCEFLKCIGNTTIEAFQFEQTDASPLFLREIASAGLTPLSFEAQVEQHKLLESVLVGFGKKRLSYTLFPCLNQRPMTRYYNAYYGWDDVNILGFGRGAQSFFNCLMWGIILVRESTYLH